MTTISVHKAKAHLSALVADVEKAGHRVVICRYGRAVAALVPIKAGKRTRISPRLNRVQFHKDPTAPTETEWDHA